MGVEPLRVEWELQVFMMKLFAGNRVCLIVCFAISAPPLATEILSISPRFHVLQSKNVPPISAHVFEVHPFSVERRPI